MKTTRGRKRIVAAFLCFATLFAMVLGGAGVKPMTVRALNITKVSINSEPEKKVDVGDSITLTATVTEENNESTSGVKWTVKSGSEEFAEVVENTGVVTGKKAGTAVIVATSKDDASKYDECSITVSYKTVTNVSLNQTMLNKKIGDADENITATVEPTPGANPEVSWSSDNDTVATVNNGIIKFVGKGKATITATTVGSPQKTATCTVNVDYADVIGITLSKTILSLEDGASETLTATVSPDGKANPNVTWISDNPEIAEVDPHSGKVTAVAVGSATITATSVGNPSTTQTCTVKVTAKPVVISGITLTSEDNKTRVAKSGTLKIKAVYTPETVTDDTINWTATSGTVSVASTTGQNAEVTFTAGTAAGKAIITATADKGGVSKSLEVDVIVPTVSITIEPDAEKTIAVGETYQLTAKLSPAEATTQTITWKSNDDSVATVDSKGLVTGKANGSTTFTATIKGEDNGGGSDITGKSKIITVSSAKPLITTTKLTDASIGIAYSETLKASVNGKEVASDTLKWTTTSTATAALKEYGLALTEKGVITGTPTKATESGKSISIPVTATTTSSVASEEKTLTLVISNSSVKVEPEVTNTANKAITGVIETDSMKAYAETLKETGKEVILEPKVVATLSAAASNNSQSSLAERINTMFNGVKTNNRKTHFLEIDLIKYVRDAGSTGSYKETDITDTTTVLEYGIEADFEDATRTPVAFRYHGNSIQQLTALSTKPTSNFTDATFYYKDKKLYVYSRYYSSYVFAYPTVQTYIVSFNTNGGSTIDPVCVERGGTITAPTSPTRSGYTFGGWFTDSALTQSWNSSTAINADTTLYARWTSSTNGGTNTSGSGTATAAEGGRGVSSPQTSDRMWALWGVILFIVILNGVYIALAARKGRNRE